MENIELTIDRDDNLGLIFIEIGSNKNPNFLITEKKLAVAPWMLSYLLKMMLISGIITPRFLIGIVDEYNNLKQEVLK